MPCDAKTIAYAPTCIWEFHFNFTETFGVRKRVPMLLCGVVCVMTRVDVLVKHGLVTDGRTDGRSDTAGDGTALAQPRP